MASTPLEGSAASMAQTNPEPSAEAVEQASCRVVVEAEDEDDRRYEWECELAAQEPVSALAKRWADHHHVRHDVVALEVEDDELHPKVDLERTPRELGWALGPGCTVRLRAVPNDKRYSEGASVANDVQTGRKAGEASEKKAAERRELKRAADEVEDPEEPQPAPKRNKAEAKAKASAPAPKASAKAAASAANSAAPKAKAAAAKAKAAASKPASPEAKASAKAAGAAAKASAAKPAAGTGKVPQGDERIVFEQENPKRPGSQSYTRYDKYKKAKTPDEALRLGAAEGDLKFDWSRGYYKRA
eukprot:gnl/TRDRNA2_/TRDRNA2_38940_c0_seq1.p1 gnl/TRDRNA2_/TRDRNA2_38940_c0~~gnl/TRDRNA2_/TRDRNA2_38940_c0_seq1.p1  ORF type:complete len:302 (-),score=84.01 gnl/TRDRNA2_/TRDRNA2_38940_c0_seq1:58-963(-)